MKLLKSRLLEVRVEAVTATFVAAGRPDGIHDLGRFLENLNNPALSHQFELHGATVRPLYRAGATVALQASLLVHRDDVIFANFEGPYLTRGLVRPPVVDTPVLLLAPPFQIQGMISLEPGADPAQALCAALSCFFLVRDARVFDAEGNVLGQGEQIVVNGAAVEMTSPTRQHITAATKPQPRTAPHGDDAESVVGGIEERSAHAA